MTRLHQEWPLMNRLHKVDDMKHSDGLFPFPKEECPCYGKPTLFRKLKPYAMSTREGQRVMHSFRAQEKRKEIKDRRHQDKIEVNNQLTEAILKEV